MEHRIDRRHRGNITPWHRQQYWPAGYEPPRHMDGSVDVAELCRRWDDELNFGAADPLSPEFAVLVYGGSFRA